MLDQAVKNEDYEKAARIRDEISKAKITPRFMNKFWCCLFLIFFGISPSFAQSISKTWNFEAVEDSTQNALFEISPGNDYLKLDNGEF